MLRICIMEAEEPSQFRDNPPGVTSKLAEASVGIAGVGGIGSNAAVILARAGVGRLVLVDHDSVELPNLNRQFYFHGQIGYPKVDALRQTLHQVNPDITLETHCRMLDRRNACELFQDCDPLVEAVDGEETKVLLLETWMSGLPGRHVFSCSGIAGHGDTDLIRVDRRKMLTIVGDQASSLSRGTLSSRVAIVAGMMANEIIEYIIGKDCPVH
ncbi:MAG: sulfur carrier protein ThiS adenylyltransferase ThiF [Candidatus Aegiribacteria sp.]